MLDESFLAYVHFFVIVLPGLVTCIVALGAGRAGLPSAAAARALLLTAGLLGLWGAVAMHLSQANIFNVPASLAEPPVVLMFLLGGSTLLWALAWKTETGRQISDHTDLGLLAAFQIPRVMGGVFLVGWAAGAIPWQFALPAGLGDIWAGVAGYQAWRASALGTPDARKKVVRANVIGVADFVVAVATGIMTSEGFLHVMAKDTPNIINLHPLAMFPSFFVPIFLAFHFVSFSKLGRKT